MTYSTYEITAFTEADLLQAGDHSLGCGDSFTMPSSATTCISVSDNDAFLSGDSYHNENADDHSGQHAAITGENGDELGNGGQIYAEFYYWVSDQHGNWYVMLEIEQEGSNDDFYTFYTGNGYTVPPEGAELTVGSRCNVSGNWVDYKCLDAGEKMDPPNPWDFDEDACTYTIQAEDFDLHGFHVVSGNQAEGGELIKISGNDGRLSTDFGGTDGVYNMTIRAQDETDGASKLMVYVNGELQETIKLQGQETTVGSNNHGFSDFTLQGLEIAEGDHVEIRAWKNGGEFVRIDEISFEQVKFEECDLEGAVKIDFEGFNAGDVLGTQLDGITISAMGGSGDAMIFDSQNPTGGDGDLETQVAQLGNVLIVSEDGDSSDPDDVVGGKITFEFDNPSTIFDLKFIDTEEGGTVTLTLADGSTQTFDVPELVNGGVGQLVMDVEDVVRMDVQLDGSGAIDDLCYVPGAAPQGSIAGRYFCDENDNSRDDGEPGIAGATVWLLEEGVGVIASTTTDSDGNYLFEGLDAGRYSVRFEDPNDVAGAEGKVFVDADQGDDVDDSDVTIVGGAGNGNTDFFDLAQGENKTDVDAGIEELLGSLSGRYFCDDNRDGLDNDGADNGVAGVLVELLDAAGNGTGITTTTDADGNYSFGGLSAGTYGVKFTDAVSGKALTTQNVDNDASDDIDSDADVSGPGMSEITGIVVVAGEDTPDNDAGVVDLLGSLSGRYFCDTDNDDVDDGNATDPGIAGVLVTLFNGEGVEIDSTFTGDDGSYSFGDLLAGEYSVSFTDPNNVLDGKVLVEDNVGGDDSIDSDAIGDTALSVINGITVNAGQNTPDNDAGAEELGSLSGRYFCDENEDGLDNEDGNGLSGVTVELLDANGNPTGRTTTTDANGNYSFAMLVPGTYGVKFTDASGKVLTAQNVGNDDAIDSDAAAISGMPGMSQILGITVNAGEDTPDNDAGVFVPNVDPTATDDMGKGCADELITVDFSDNFSDADSASVGITMIDGVAIAAGQTVNIGGVNVTLTADDEFIFDGAAAYSGLDIGDEATQSFTVKVEDSDGGAATATIDVTFCGDANSLDSLVATLPASVTYQVTDDFMNAPIGESAYDLLITGSGDARLDGVVFEQAYCLSFTDAINGGASFASAPFLTGDVTDGKDGSVFNAGQVGIANGQSAADNLDLVNWILAQDYENNGAGSVNGDFNGWEVQLAIWELTDTLDPNVWNGANSASDFLYDVLGDPAFGQRDDVDFIVQQALSLGEGFMAMDGDIASFIVDPNPSTAINSQPFIVAFNYDDFDCLC